MASEIEVKFSEDNLRSQFQATINTIEQGVELSSAIGIEVGVAERA